jgi:hypothetical protein
MEGNNSDDEYYNEELRNTLAEFEDDVSEEESQNKTEEDYTAELLDTLADFYSVTSSNVDSDCDSHEDYDVDAWQKVEEDLLNDQGNDMEGFEKEEAMSDKKEKKSVNATLHTDKFTFLEGCCGKTSLGCGSCKVTQEKVKFKSNSNLAPNVSIKRQRNTDLAANALKLDNILKTFNVSPCCAELIYSFSNCCVLHIGQIL